MLKLVETPVENESPADRAWGFEFGVDGGVSTKDACGILGGIHRSTLDRKWKAGLVRKGKHEAKVVFCRRSLGVYLKGREI